MLIPLFDILKPEITESKIPENKYQILTNDNEFKLLSFSNLEGNYILTKRLVPTELAHRNALYIDQGIIHRDETGNGHNRVLLFNIPFTKEDFGLEDLKRETIKNNKHVHNCLRTKCQLDFQRLLENGYSEGYFMVPKIEINQQILQIAFLINYNEETTEQNYVDKIDWATKFNKVMLSKSHLLYDELIMRRNLASNCVKFLTEFYKMRNSLKLEDSEKEKKPHLMELRKDYPTRFNYLLLGYDDLELYLSNFENNSKFITQNIVEDLGRLKIKYLYK